MVVFVIFLMSQRWIKEPILNLSIFSNRNVSAATGVNLLVGFCIMVALVSVPLFINVAGSSEDTRKAALVTGYLLCAFTVPMALAAIPGGWLSSRFGYRWSVMLRPRRRRPWLPDDEFLEGGDGEAGGRVLRSARRSGHEPMSWALAFMAAGLALAESASD